MFEHPVIALVATVGLVLAGLVIALLPLELYALHRRGALQRTRVREMLASASPLVPTLLTEGLALMFVAAVFTGAAKLALWQLPVTWWSAGAAIIAADFVYYWDHRAGHGNRLYWAISHSVHHSSPTFDQTTGLRVSFVDGFVSPVFYLPLVLLGLDPGLVIASLLVVVGYQQWLHTEAIGRLPLLDPWLNTPSNHRVHHGVQVAYLDRNFGGIFIVWDRLFGTYVREDEPVRYGLTKPLASTHPWRVHTAELTRLVRDLAATPRSWDRLARLWHGPAWEPRSPRVTSPSAAEGKRGCDG